MELREAFSLTQDGLGLQRVYKGGGRPTLEPLGLGAGLEQRGTASSRAAPNATP